MLALSPLGRTLLRLSCVSATELAGDFWMHAEQQSGLVVSCDISAYWACVKLPARYACRSAYIRDSISCLAYLQTPSATPA